MDLNYIFERNESAVSRDAASLARADRSLLRLFDGSRTLAAVVATSPLLPQDTIEAARWLGARGLIRPRS